VTFGEKLVVTETAPADWACTEPPKARYIIINTVSRLTRERESKLAAQETLSTRGSIRPIGASSDGVRLAQKRRLIGFLAISRKF
jgi:hypothetical protein